MVIVYHFANPDIEKIILLGAFIILIIGGIQLKIKRDYIKFSILFILSGLITTLWYTIFFFIPAFMFTTPPTPTEIQFADNYIFIWHNLVPNIILISSFGIINIIIGQFNRNTYGLYLMTSGIVFCISIILDMFDNIISSFIVSIIMGFSLSFFLYFSIKIKSPWFVAFCALYLFSIVFPLIIPDHYIIVF